MAELEKAKERNLFLIKQVDQESIGELTKLIVDINESDIRLKKLYDIDGLIYIPKPIKIHIDSYGGSVYQCYGLLSIMENSTTPIHTIVTGCAMSAGFMILICGHKRYAHKLSTVLYHQVSHGIVGKLKDMEEDLFEAKRLQNILEGIVLTKTKITENKLEKIFKQKKDWYIDSNEALKLGVVDEVI